MEIHQSILASLIDTEIGHGDGRVLKLDGLSVKWGFHSRSLDFWVVFLDKEENIVEKDMIFQVSAYNNDQNIFTSAS